MECSSCGAQNRPDRKFCTRCGTPLLAVCPTCAVPTDPADAFCGECGSALGGSAPPAAAAPRTTATPAGPGPSATVSERRHVSVLFCDLVGFTSLSESRDAEDVRELLSRYFELARSVVERYAGTVEKFIGDAVMAVWGVPAANEDDAERAVRAALDLVAAVGKLGTEVGGPDLCARAGVLTAEAAVTVGATGQGMVAGDLVNTASRLQSSAEPGTVLVGEATYLAARDAVAFAEAGPLELKGKGGPVPAWRALRVVAQRRGAGRSSRLEPPFVGRDDELRLLVDLLHATAREAKSRLVAVTGTAGIGKSRLGSELLKYVDGLADTVYWHQGRSPAYGEGITFWALAEMVRMRARISDLEAPDPAREKLAAVVADFIPREEERRWLEPHLAHLLGLAHGPSSERNESQDRNELFSAWRTFFQRISERGTVVMVFEDLQWADSGLVDFVDSLVEWSRSHPILVVTLARPEFADRRPTWGAGARNFTSLHLDPLDDAAMRELLHGLVRGMPDEATEQLVRRADGVPLYAVETVRSLVDRGVIVQFDDAYELLGEVDDLQIPDSLQSLIASRLDTLPPEQRALLQVASVLGKTFTAPALAAVADADEAGVSGQLQDLVRREFLLVDSDPRSPERGQYGFVQAVVREVAYGTLSKRDRRAKHLAAARQFERTGDDELAGLVAAHYMEAYRTSAADDEREELVALARRWLTRAAERALSLGSPEQALGYAEQALEETPVGEARAALLELAGRCARLAWESDRAVAYLDEAIAYYERTGDPTATARATMEFLRSAAARGGRFRPPIERGELTFAALAEAGTEEVRVGLAEEISGLYHGAGDHASSLAWADTAIRIAERLDDVSLFGNALRMRSAALFSLGRHREAAILQRGLTSIADASGSAAEQAVSRLFESLYILDDEPRRALRAADEAAELARRAGDRMLQTTNVLNAIEMSLFIGELRAARQRLDRLATGTVLGGDSQTWAEVLGVLHEGLTATDEHAIGALARLEEMLRSVEYVHMRTTFLRAKALVLLAHGRFDQACGAVRELVEADPEGINTCMALAFMGHAALCGRDAGTARDALSGMASFHGRWTLAARATIAAGLSALEGGGAQEAAAAFRAVAAQWETVGSPLDLALCAMDAAFVLDDGERPEELVADARRLLGEMGAAPLLALLDERTGARAGSGAGRTD
jgi:class 3 adenylate cyclase/tetratricopeptide (TPR) repeat protein